MFSSDVLFFSRCPRECSFSRMTMASASAHAGIPDTSEMLYLGGDKGWVRKDLVATALGDPVLPRGQAPDPALKRINNGISGDGRTATAELGKRLFDLKVDYAVAQIRRLMEPKP